MCPGLLGGWYDACVGWEDTADREHVFSMGTAVTMPEASVLYAKQSETVAEKDWAGKKIGQYLNFLIS